MAAITDAVVIDVEAEVLSHNNGGRWLRLVLSRTEAGSLLHELQKLQERMAKS